MSTKEEVPATLIGRFVLKSFKNTILRNGLNFIGLLDFKKKWKNSRQSAKNQKNPVKSNGSMKTIEALFKK
jgi:hypothetical protein